MYIAIVGDSRNSCKPDIFMVITLRSILDRKKTEKVNKINEQNILKTHGLLTHIN